MAARHLHRSDDLTDLLGTPVTMEMADEILNVFGTVVGGKGLHERNVILRAQEIRREGEERHREAVRQADAELHEREQAISVALGDLGRGVRDTVAELQSGRLDARSARQRLAKAEEERRALLARLDQLQRDDDAADALAEQGATAWEADLLRTYPALLNRLPQITPGDLKRRA